MNKILRAPAPPAFLTPNLIKTILNSTVSLCLVSGLHLIQRGSEKDFLKYIDKKVTITVMPVHWAALVAVAVVSTRNKCYKTFYSHN